MGNITFTPQEKDKILDYFGESLEYLSSEDFEARLKELRLKYHPDKFAQYNDATIIEMAEEKFKEIESLSDKIKIYFLNFEVDEKLEEENITESSSFAYNDLKIEIITDNTDFKYHLFRKHYRSLSYGERFHIPGTNAFLIMDDHHEGKTIGFLEGIKLYLTFSETDSVEEIVAWLYLGIKGHAKYVIIENKKAAIDYVELLYAIKKKTVLSIGNGLNQEE